MIHITDYCDFYFQSLENQPPPPKRGGKYVFIVQIDGPVHAVFSPIGLSVFHANIVERFMSEHSIAGRWNTANDKYFIDDKTWQIAGGGHWELDTHERLLELRGKSLAYGRPHASHLKSLILVAQKHFNARVVTDQ